MFALRRLARYPSVVRSAQKTKTNVVIPVRHSGGPWTYRERGPRPDEKSGIMITINVVFFGMWYWILYHLATQYDHVIGHFAYPDPSKWTDEELGIPPDDEE